ncbi:MAG TPA: hypothetical protein VG268_11090 [Streptosporangiaceae bacterium]|jgi:hypothetical protein|nr:hypothetical protein [Streptosporangiaceae bacterium]
MRERLRLLNGTLVAGALDGHWVVAAGRPLAAPAQPADPAAPDPLPAHLVAS